MSRSTAGAQRPVVRDLRFVVSATAVLCGELMVLLGVDVPFLRAVVGAIVLAGVPIYILTTRTRGPEPAARAVYSVGTTVLTVMGVALLVNLVLPWFGVGRPLSPASLVPLSTAADLSLLLWRRDRAPRWRRPHPHGTAMLGMAAVALCVIGAIRLNNGAGNLVALTGLACAAGALGALVLRRDDNRGFDSWIIYLVALALLASTSMRGWYTTGHDAQKENLVFHLTDSVGHWQMSALQDPYNACLSLNLLPTVIANFTAITGPLLAKIAPQLIFAAVPVAGYLLSRRVTSRRLALVGVLVVVTFPTFSIDMPYMARQEVAFLFLALLLLAGTEPGWSRRVRQVAVVLAGIGVVVSHYSTAYILVLTLGTGWILSALVRVWRRFRAGPRPPRPCILAVTPIVLITVVTAAWVGPATRTSGHAGTVVTDTAEALTGSSRPLVSSDVASTILPLHVEDPQQRLDDFSREQLELSKAQRTAGQLLPVTPDEAYPRLAADAPMPTTPVGRVLHSIGFAPATVNGLAQSASGKAVQVSLLIGFVLLLRRRRRGPRFTYEYRLLCLATLTILGLVAVLPDVSVEYGIFRAFLQALLLLAPVAALGLSWLLTPLRHAGRLALPLLGALFIGFFATMTSASGAILGAGEPQIRLFNDGDYYRTFYVTDQEAAAARFVATQHPASVMVDEYAAHRLAAFLGDVTPLPDNFYPSRLLKDGWQLAGPEVVRDHMSTLSIAGGDRATYVYPLDLVRGHRDVVYSNGSADVFRSDPEPRRKQ